jgi:S-DNA-T family DNA segregation ATPase FtsK/SpoIIIE
VTAGGDPASFDAMAPAGRAVLGGRVVQFALPSRVEPRSDAEIDLAAVWHPRSSITAVVVRGARGRTAELAHVLDGARVLSLGDLAAGTAIDERPGAHTVVVGDPDGWQRQWTLFSRLRADADIVIGTTCATDFRALTGRRELPPYSRESGERAWLIPPSGPVVRVRLPGGAGAVGAGG